MSRGRPIQAPLRADVGIALACSLAAQVTARWRSTSARASRCRRSRCRRCGERTACQRSIVPFRFGRGGCSVYARVRSPPSVGDPAALSRLLVCYAYGSGLKLLPVDGRHCRCLGKDCWSQQSLLSCLDSHVQVVHAQRRRGADAGLAVHQGARDHGSVRSLHLFGLRLIGFLLNSWLRPRA